MFVDLRLVYSQDARKKDREGKKPTRTTPPRNAKGNANASRKKGKSGSSKKKKGKGSKKKKGKGSQSASVTDLANEFSKMGEKRKKKPKKPTKKRRLFDPEDLLVQCEPVGDRVQFGGSWVVYKCPKAFLRSHPCTAALCRMCFLEIKDKMRTADNEDGEDGSQEKVHKRKSGRLTDGQTAGSANQSSISVVGGKDGMMGGCGHHTYADMDKFSMETDETFPRRTRKETEHGYENIANNCWACGKVF